MAKKIFISVGMAGRDEKDVLNDISRAKHDLVWKVFGKEVDVLHNYYCEAPADSGRLYYLGEAIKTLGQCDACYFVTGWQKYKGCRAEYEICRLYGIEIIEET